MMSRPPRAGRLSDGQARRLFARYKEAHRQFTLGDFPAALRIYESLRAALHPHFVAIVKRNLGCELAPGEDLSDAQVAETLAGVTEGVIRRLKPGSREGKTAALCSAMAHDVALICRHLAEGTSRGRDPEIATAIVASFAHAIAVDPTNPINYHNLAGYEDYLGFDARACLHYRLALQLNQHQWESWVSWGHAAARLDDLETAEACWKNALMVIEAHERRDVETTGVRQRRWGVSMLRLLKGDYVHGWDDYEARLTFPPYMDKHGRPDLTAPLWNDHRPPRAMTLRSDVVLLHQEQGIGDAVQMARYVPLAQERVGAVIIEVVKALVPLFEAMFPDVQIVARGEPLPRHDTQLPVFSLPFMFGTTLEDIPDPPPFRPTTVEGLSIQAEPGRIGLCWAGSKTHPNDLIRSMPFEACFPLLDLPGLAWQSLQFGYEVSPPLEPLPLGDFLETARQIARCSLVITVDTSTAHIAGAMGVPTWILLPRSAEWRWLEGREDSPWYPSVRLWRQTKAGDWRELVGRVVQSLQSQDWQ